MIASKHWGLQLPDGSLLWRLYPSRRAAKADRNVHSHVANPGDGRGFMQIVRLHIVAHTEAELRVAAQKRAKAKRSQPDTKNVLGRREANKPPRRKANR